MPTVTRTYSSGRDWAVGGAAPNEPEAGTKSIVIDTKAPTAPANADYMPFRPALEERFMERFARSARDLCVYTSEDRTGLIRQEIAWASAQISNKPQAAIYKAIWNLLGDLSRADWSYRWHRSTFEVAPPSVNTSPKDDASIHAYKAYCRDLYRDSRAKGIEEARDFILAMERPRLAGLSIRDLFADGAVLADDLGRVKSVTDAEKQVRELARIVQPYLQLVEPNARCQFTGLRLGDIWRYCRLTWSIPRYNTPGRSLFYLVRDRARPNHPVMGILSFENAPIFIRARDTYVGWSVESFVASLDLLATATDGASRIRDEFQFLVRSVVQASARVAASDVYVATTNVRIPQSPSSTAMGGSRGGSQRASCRATALAVAGQRT